MSRISSLTPLVLVALAPLARAGDVWKVPSDAPNIQIAVNVAAPGDVILVAPGTYTQVVTVDGKGVAIVAETSATLATLIVKNVPAGQTFLLDGFTLDLPDVFAGPDIPFMAEDNAGALRLQECTFLGDPGYAGVWMAGVAAYSGSAGARVSDCASVVFHRCTFLGGLGADLFDEDIDAFSTNGGDGLLVVDSNVAVYDSVATGRNGGSNFDTVGNTGTRGGSGISASGAGKLAVHGSTLTGGHGGTADCDFFGCGDGGAGGSGVLLSGSLATSSVRDNVYHPGLGGGAGGFGANDGADGLDVSGGAANITTFAQRYRALSVSTPVREGGFALFSFEGQPGDTVLLFASLDPAHATLPLHAGVYGMGSPLLLPGAFIGTVPPGGPLPMLLSIPELGAGIEGFALQLQPVFVDGAGAWLGPVDLLTLLDAAF